MEIEGGIYDLIIIGGGPAGMTAGIYGGREKLKTLIIAEGFGGQMAKKAVDIENYPGFPKISGFDLIKKFKEHAQGLGAEIVVDKINSLKKGGEEFFVETISSKQYQAKTVIIASGAEPKMLNIPGEKEFIGKGISYCPTCDGPFFRGKEVAVIGGGNAGCEATAALLKYVSKVYIIEFNNFLAADRVNKDIVSGLENVEIIYNSKLKEIKGTNRVEEIIYTDRETNEDKTLKVAGVMVEVGFRPETSFIQDGLVDYSEMGEIKADFNTAETKTPGLFAAGDVSGGKCKQIVVAAGEGAKAAIECRKYIK